MLNLGFPKSIFFLFFLFPFAEARAELTVGGGLGALIVVGDGIQKMNQRLGESRLLALESEHGLMPRYSLSLSVPQVVEGYEFAASYWSGHDVVSSSGLSSRVNSRFDLSSIELGLSLDISSVDGVRRAFNSIGVRFGQNPFEASLRRSSVALEAGLFLGLEFARHRMRLDTDFEFALVDYAVSQKRPMLGAQVRFRARTFKDIQVYFLYASRFSFPLETQLEVNSFVIRQDDMTQKVRDEGKDSLKMGHFFQHEFSCGLRYELPGDFLAGLF